MGSDIRSDAPRPACGPFTNRLWSVTHCRIQTTPEEVVVADAPKPPVEEESELAPNQEDPLFQAQMWVYDRVMAYWKHGALAVGVILVGSLVYGLYDSWSEGRAKDAEADIAAIDFRVPKPSELSMMGIGPADDLNDATRVANLEEGARRFQATAEDASGPQAAQAWLKAAELWQRLGRDAETKTAFEGALKAEGDGAFGFVAHNGLASIALDEGKVDEAIVHFRAVADADRGFFGEQALIGLARAQAQNGKGPESLQTMEELRKRYPESPRLTDLAVELGAPAAPVAPTVAPGAPSTAPAAPTPGSG
jgi:tetratricopeptide (TPR) repeat protein